MRLPLLVSLASAATCGSRPTEISVNEEFELRAGQSARLAEHNTVITFEAVRQDSRCPVDVTCVWAGNAIVVLRLGGSHRDTLLELNTALEPKHSAVDGLELELHSLEPVPRSGKSPAARDYRARLRLVAP